MKKIIPALLLLLTAAYSFAQQSDAKFSGFRQAETRHFRFIFEEESREATENYALYADEAWNKIARAYSIPQDKIDVYVTARTNTVNAYTFFLPPEIMMFNSPVLTPEFGFRDEWQKLFFTHELIHGANVTFESKSYFGSKLFGNALRAWNYSAVPGWAMEGLTTVLETELSDGGRGRSPYFEMMFKAPTIDNGFLSYAEIENSNEPPAGPAYVMGYLIMRSSADRWGLDTLADIERNRIFDWEDAVKQVTGVAASDIYLETRSALSKKFNRERTIPEGKIISPRQPWLSYHYPVLVLDDGSMILIKSGDGAPAVIQFRPGAEDGCENFKQDFRDKINKNLESILESVEDKDSSDKKEKDPNEGHVKETILFNGMFPDEFSVTADENLNVYSVQPKVFADRAPGVATETPLFVWSPDDGLRQLTKNISLFQPSVSRKGNLLVALQQKGMKTVLVQVDTKTGEITDLYADEKYCIAEPVVNADGSKIAFLTLTGKRALVQVLDVASKKVETVFNDGETIYDPAYPSWNSEGKLSFTSNNRGRLEVYEYDDAKKIAEVVVSDPIAALWADKTDKGIIYASYSSTGYVLKIKPDSEWKKVPDFNGPSMPGQIMTFGSLEDDYPSFNPFNVGPSEDVVYRSSWYKNGKKFVSSADKKSEDSDETKPETENAESEKSDNQSEAFTEVITTLQNERPYVREIQPVLYFPSIGFAPGIQQTLYGGFGYNFLAFTSRAAEKQGLIAAGIYYYPKLQNVSGAFFAELPFANSQADILFLREFHTNGEGAEKTFNEVNMALASFTSPILRRSFYSNAVDLSWLAEVDVRAMRSSLNEISLVQTDIPYNFYLNFQTGLDLFAGRMYDNSTIANRTSAYFLGEWSSKYEQLFMGVEAVSNLDMYLSWINLFTNVKFRYMDNGSASETPLFSNVTFAGQHLNSLYPGHLVLEAGLNLGGMRVSEEILFNMGKSSVHSNTPDNDWIFNMALEDKLVTNIAFVIMDSGRTYMDCGFAFSYNILTGSYEYDDLFFNIHMDWLRF